MKRPNLEEFISDQRTGRARKLWPSNLIVKEPGFTFLYVRWTSRFFEGFECYPTLDISNVTARFKGKGTFTSLIERLRANHPDVTIYVECVANTRFEAKLQRMGFKPQLNMPSCWYMLGTGRTPISS